MTVYAMGALGTGLVKIGFTTKSPNVRMNELQVGCPYKLVLLGIWEGDMYAESCTHSQLKAINIRGEWFDFSLVDWFKYASQFGHELCEWKLCKSLNEDAIRKFCIMFPRTASSHLLMIVLWELIGMYRAHSLHLQGKQIELDATQAKIEQFLQESKP